MQVEKNGLDICIISLQEQWLRRKTLTDFFDSLSIPYRVSIAINGKQLSAQEYFFNCKIKTSRFYSRKLMTPSELGCFFSHQQAIETFLQGDDPWLLVLEDDVLIENNFAELVTLLPQLDKAMLYILGGQEGLASFKRVIFKNESNKFKRPLLGTHRWLYRSCCYLISRQTAQSIAKLMRRDRYITDDWAWVVRHSEIKQVYYKKYFSHPVELANSTIEEERLFLKK